MFDNFLIHTFHDGNCLQAYKIFGAHFETHEGKKGVRFTTYAPNARSAQVVGEFNQWGETPCYMERYNNGGIYTIFVEGVKEFDMYKFRSMKVQEESEEKKAWTTKDDPRVTHIGKFMRKTNIDELPQIFNVLKGDMSLVGPRPERPYFVNKFKEEIPRYMIKHQVRPGMTGWAQVNGFRGDTSITGRIECDLYYVENWTMALDFKILFLTFFGRKVNKNAY